ncbi:MAG: polysaccharide biosynthesis protein [Gemmatimonadales bacterium]|nr:MAG: polysaccharide biosynthesis protein [Gemmatimonadales bacterium]
MTKDRDLPELLELPRRRRVAVAYGFYAVATAAALVTAYSLRFDLQVPEAYVAALPLHLAGLVVLRLILARGVRLMAGRWRYVGVDDVLRLGAASTASSVLFLALFRGVAWLPAVPVSVVLIEWAAFTVGVGGVWIGYRRLVEVNGIQQARRNGGGPERRIVVVGAGAAGNHLARELNQSGTGMRVVAFLDDNPILQGLRIQGVGVLGTTADAAQVAESVAADEVAIAIPSATPRELRGMVEALEPLELPMKVVPGIVDLVSGDVSVGTLRPLEIDDLLGRDPVRLELPELEEELAGRTVMVTGAAGSIGSELARQVAANGPERLILVDQAETGLYWIDLELQDRYDEVEVIPCVADVCDEERITELFESHRPDRVYHAAAYKHVPMMERNPGEAMRTNVLGTRNVARAAGKARTGRFVLISTDKAADPVNVMGATKRAAEIVVQKMQAAHPRTHYTAVRFGNVLGSNGSVVPLFQRQIARGGPVTITHPEVTRYFMTIPEAVQLILKAGFLDEARGEIAMLEMGDPVRIVDLARNMVRLHGKRPEVDIPFTFTGLRPGEKLHERLVGNGEEVRETSLAGVRIVTAPAEGGAERALELLVGVAVGGGRTAEAVVEVLAGVVGGQAGEVRRGAALRRA